MYWVLAYERLNMFQSGTSESTLVFHIKHTPQDTIAFIWLGEVEISSCLICHIAIVGVIQRASYVLRFLLLKHGQITMRSCYGYR